MQANPFSVAEKQILVCGGTRGIGGAITTQLARAGARVLAVYSRDTQSAEALSDDAAREGWDLECVRADLTRPKGVDKLFARLDEKWGALSGMIYSAATGIHRPIDELTLRHFDFTFALNVRAFLDVSQRCLPYLGTGSSIIAISSAGAERAVEQYAMTGSSKGALESLVRHLAAELAPREIGVNCLSPGTVETDAWKVLPHGSERLEEAATKSPRGRLTTLEEVACVAQFLCSEAARGIVGQRIVVDNGCRIME